MLKEFNILNSSTSRRSIANTLYQFARHNALEWCHDHVRCCAKQKPLLFRHRQCSRSCGKYGFFYANADLSVQASFAKKMKVQGITQLLARRCRCRASVKNIQIIISGYLYLSAKSVDKRDRSWKAAKRWKMVWSAERGGGKEKKLNLDTQAQQLIAFMSLRATFQFPFHRESSKKLLNWCWNSSRILRKEKKLFHLFST